MNRAVDQRVPTGETARVVSDRIVDALRELLGPGPVPLHEPRFAGREWEYTKTCLDSTFVSSVGKFVDRFESDICEFTGAAHAVAVVNGTEALHVALLLAGVQEGDEVLVPALTFVATANAVRYCDAIPHFVDCDEMTLGVDPASLRDWLGWVAEVRSGVCVNKRTGRPIRAMVPMHVFGHPCNLDGLMAVSRDFGLQMVEDAAESLGSTYYGRHTGTFGLLGTLSFNGNKIITSGGGGAILTNDHALAVRAKHLTTTAKLAHRWAFEHDEVGFNYRMPNINAALGCAQLENISSFLESKRQLFERYLAVFQHIPEVRLIKEPAGCKSNYWLQTLVLDESNAGIRDGVLEATNRAGYMTRPAWGLMHRQPMFSACQRMRLDVAENMERRLINIPSSAGLAGRA